MGRIASYTQRYSVPLRLHPPVSFADSPPWQGGPRGLSNPANKAKAATNQQRATTSQNPILNNKTQKQLQEAATSDHMARAARRPADTPRVPGVQRAAALWRFSPGFSRKAGPWPGRPPPVGWQPYTWCVSVGVHAVRLVRTHPPSNVR